MDPSLEQVLLARQVRQAAGPAVADTPQEMPNSSTKVPPQWQRYVTAQKMQHAYANGWQPNPMLIRVTDGK